MKSRKYLLAGSIGAILGIIVSIIYLFKIWMPQNIDKIGLAILALFGIKVK